MSFDSKHRLQRGQIAAACLSSTSTPDSRDGDAQKLVALQKVLEDRVASLSRNHEITRGSSLYLSRNGLTAAEYKSPGANLYKT